MLNLKKIALMLLVAAAAAGTANAGEVLVDADVVTSTTWTADNVYRLQKQIYVLPGATLTIEAGTRVESTAGVGGSLAVCRGAKIYVNGTKDAPVVMTSTNDDGTWREACTEWGNLTIMGDALIGGYSFGGTVQENTDGDDLVRYPHADNERQMEGLVAGPATDFFGGANDDDDSGSISYLSLRYGGKVVGLTNELNGLSLGGIGRETEINHVEIMNNVDDGIEIWGGTVNLKYVSIWNIGDDSFDIDQGWRGKAQFGLIVQGYSIDDDQGSGVGDNMVEMDGAEDSDGQPVTTGAIYNFTLIGQPLDGDGATAWRCNARMQFRNCVIMDCGEKVVRPDGDDGDGQEPYGYNGTLSWAATWNTDADDIANATAGFNLGSYSYSDLYKSQDPDGKLIEITDTVFFSNTDYNEADARGVFAAGNNNVKEPVNMPIQGITRADAVLKGGKAMQRVTSLNPCAANDAVTSVGAAPADGFFTPAPFRGAFSKDHNWLAGWTAADEFGLIDTSMNEDDPEATVEVTVQQVETATTFADEAGVVYTVEKSGDLKNWTPVETIVGDGGTHTVTDSDSFGDAKFYRVIRQ
jgi:hypothetical protein